MSRFSVKQYIGALRASLEAHYHETDAIAQSKYMKNLFPFFGIKTPARNEIIKAHLKAEGIPEYEDLETVVKACFKAPERDFHYFAIGLCSRYVKKQGAELLPLLEYTITTKSWWDSVDYIVSVSIRPLFKKDPALMRQVTRRWMDSGNMWLQRSALICQLGFRDQTDEKMLYSYIRELNGGKEFFINKAIGWALREYSKTHPESVRKFIAGNKLAGLSVREGSKYL